MNYHTLIDITGGALTVALITVVTRWVSAQHGADTPECRDGEKVYGVRWQYRALAIAAVAFFGWLLIAGWQQKHQLDRFSLIMAVVFVLAGLSVSTGTVTTNDSEIRKTFLGRAKVFRWAEITEIRIHRRDGGAIDLRAGSSKMIIGSNIRARAHLLDEIKERTHREPSPG